MDWQGEVNGVGGAGVGGAEEGVEVERVGVGLRDCRSGFLLGVWDGLEPFGREDGGDEAGGTGNGGGETAGAEGGEVDEEVELVGGTAAIDTTVESDGKDIAVDGGRSDFHSLHRAATDDDAREVDLAVGSKAILVEVLEDGVGAVLLPNGMPVEADEVCLWILSRSCCDGPVAPQFSGWPQKWAWNARIADRARCNISCCRVYRSRNRPVFLP